MRHRSTCLPSWMRRRDTRKFILIKTTTKFGWSRLEAQAKNNVGWSKVAKACCITLQSPPEPPHLSLVQTTSNSLKLKWSPVDSSELLYFYLEKQSDNGKCGLVYEGENHSAKIKGLRESSSHQFRIRASRVRASPALAGKWSPWTTFHTSRQPPVGIRSAPMVTEIQAGVLQIEWQSYNNKASRDSSGGDESSSTDTYYKLQVFWFEDLKRLLTSSLLISDSSKRKS